MAKQPVKPTGKTATQPTNEHSAGMTFRVPIDDSLHQGIGDSSPERLRAINILRNNAKQQLEWAKEEQKAHEETSKIRKEIEGIRLELQSTHFKTEKEIDELVLKAEIAQIAYAAHTRELAERKSQNVKFINAVTDQEIQIVSHEFAERIRSSNTKTEQKKAAATAKYEAEIAQEKAKGSRETDKGEAERKAIAARRMKAYISGKPMQEVEAIGGSQGGAVQNGQVALLDKFTFDFGKS